MPASSAAQRGWRRFFGADQLWQLAPTKEGNTVLVAGRGVAVPDRDTLSARADAIQARFNLPARKWLRLVRPWQPAAAASGT